MPTGYRSVILAFGLILLGASPPKEYRSQPTEATSSKVERSLEDIAASQREIAKPSNLDQPCEEGENKRSSDLCAQWKAADAAESAKNATWLFGTLGTLIGALTLGAASAAALYAKRAADHTETGAKAALDAADETREANAIARDTAKRQLRAYMSVAACEIEALDDGIEFILTARLRNAGQTPAYKVRIMGESFGDEYPLRQERPFLAIGEGHESTVGPGDDFNCAYKITTGNNELAISHVLAGKMGLYIQGICEYEDAFGELRETRFRYVFGGRIANTGGLMLHAAETGNTAT